MKPDEVTSGSVADSAFVAAEAAGAACGCEATLAPCAAAAAAAALLSELLSREWPTAAAGVAGLGFGPQALGGGAATVAACSPLLYRRGGTTMGPMPRADALLPCRGEGPCTCTPCQRKRRVVGPHRGSSASDMVYAAVDMWQSILGTTSQKEQGALQACMIAGGSPRINTCTTAQGGTWTSCVIWLCGKDAPGAGLLGTVRSGALTAGSPSDRSACGGMVLQS